MLPHVHPSNCHQGSIKGANLQQSQLWPVSSVFSAVVSASALIIDVSPCVRQTMMDRCWEVCRLQGGAPNSLPLTLKDTVFLKEAEETGESEEVRNDQESNLRKISVCLGLGNECSVECYIFRNVSG